MGERLRLFTAEAMGEVPRSGGTYFLFRGRELLCAAVAAGGATLQSELSARLRREPDTGSATRFAWIATDDPLQAYRLQLEAYALSDVYERLLAQQSGDELHWNREHDRRGAFVRDRGEGLKIA
jgi:hypothetical protein